MPTLHPTSERRGACCPTCMLSHMQADTPPSARLRRDTYPVAVRAQERALRVCLRTRSGASNSAANSAPPMSPTEALGAAAPCRRVRRCGGHSHNRVHLRSHARHASSRLGRSVRSGTLTRPRTAPSCLSLRPRAARDTGATAPVHCGPSSACCPVRSKTLS